LKPQLHFGVVHTFAKAHIDQKGAEERFTIFMPGVDTGRAKDGKGFT
jgi:hypothetical protein